MYTVPPADEAVTWVPSTTSLTSGAGRLFGLREARRRRHARASRIEDPNEDTRQAGKAVSRRTRKAFPAKGFRSGTHCRREDQGRSQRAFGTRHPEARRIAGQTVRAG